MRPPYSVLARRMGPGGAGAPKGRRARNKPEAKIRRKKGPAGAGRGLHCVRIYKVHGSKGGRAVRSRLDAGAASYVQALPPRRRAAPSVTGSSGAW